MAEPTIGKQYTLPLLAQGGRDTPGNGREFLDDGAPRSTTPPKVGSGAQWISNAVVNAGSGAKDNMIEGTGVAAGVSVLGAARAWQQTGFQRGQFNLKAPISVNAAKLFGPALVFSLLGPAAADGITYLAPGTLPKYSIDMDADQKMWTQAKRAGIAATVGTAVGGVIFLARPQWLKPIGSAINGSVKTTAAPPGVFPVEPIKQLGKAVVPVATIPAAYAAYDHADIADALGNTVGRLERTPF